MEKFKTAFDKSKNFFDWDKLPISKKIRIMFKKQHYSKDEFSNDYRGIYTVYLDNVMYVNDNPFPKIGVSNCWTICSKDGGSFVLLKIGFTNNECEGKSVYLTILNFGLWCRWWRIQVSIAIFALNEYFVFCIQKANIDAVKAF